MEVFMTIRRTSVILMVFIGCLSAVSAVAQDRGSLYLGGSFSLTDATIIDQFTRYREGVLIEKNTFEDEYNGQGYGFYLGYRLLDKQRLFINVQMHANFYSKEFNIETSSSTLKRKLFCSRGIDLQSGYNITQKLFFYVNLSLERARFQFLKKGTTTTYDVDVPVSGYGYGMGVGFHLLPSVTVKMQYHFTQFGATEISNTVGDDGEKVDAIELLPRYDFALLSVQYNFGKRD